MGQIASPGHLGSTQHSWPGYAKAILICCTETRIFGYFETFKPGFPYIERRAGRRVPVFGGCRWPFQTKRRGVTSLSFVKLFFFDRDVDVCMRLTKIHISVQTWGAARGIYGHRWAFSGPLGWAIIILKAAVLLSFAIQHI